jgi:hypothetical protein
VVTVDYTTASATATADSDFTATTGTVTFAAGETVKTVVVQITDDATPEGPEQFNLNLSNASGATILDGQAIALIGASDAGGVGAPSISVADLVVSEADGYVDIVVSLSAPGLSPVAVNYTTVNQTAVGGFDLTGVSGTLNFAVGETTKVVRVELLDDGTVEALETFRFNLSAPVNASLANTFATVTIVDNDPAAPPVILDLDGDGLEFVAMGDAANQALFDFNGNGTKETAAWVGKDDGFLVFDANRDRVVNDGSEIAFADMTAEADTDLEALQAVFDSNGDGILTDADEQFSRFGVWQDANSNGATEGGEYKTLDEMGIVSLGLSSNGQSYSAANEQVTIHGEANFTYQDGSQGRLGDVSLAIGESPSSSTETTPFDLVLSRQANDLRSAVYGERDWCQEPSSTVPDTVPLQTSNGQTLLSSQVNQLIEAMAGFSANNNGMTWDQGLAAKPEEVQAVVAASWQG